MNRKPGRHRLGAPAARVAPRRWDPAKTAAAARLDRLEPGWAISYGVGSRRFLAIATWDISQPLRVEAGTAEELDTLMREAEIGTIIGGPRGRAA